MGSIPQMLDLLRLPNPQSPLPVPDPTATPIVLKTVPGLTSPGSVPGPGLLTAKQQASQTLPGTCLGTSNSSCPRWVSHTLPRLPNSPSALPTPMNKPQSPPMLEVVEIRTLQSPPLPSSHTQLRDLSVSPPKSLLSIHSYAPHCSRQAALAHS